MASPTAHGLSDVRLLHELTKHGDGLHLHDDRLVAFPRMDSSNRPEPFKRYLGRPALPLPADLPVPDQRATDTLSGHRAPGESVVDDRTLARLLFLAAGVTRVARPSGLGGQQPIWFRAAMSAGNLHPVEVYLVCGELPGVPAGVHHFAPEEFGLTPLRTGDYRPLLAEAAADASVASAPATIVLTGLPWRTGWKYGERGFRHLYWDAGTLLGNLLAAGDAGGVPARILGGFVDAAVSDLVGIDGTGELPLVLAVLGPTRGPAAPAAAASPVEALDLDVAPLSARPITFPLVVDAQAAGSLASPESVARWREAAGNREPADGTLAPPAAEVPPVDEVILARGSTRVMRPAAVSREFLEWSLAVAARPVPGDLDASGWARIGHWLSVHAVEGVAAGAYRLGDKGLDLVRAGDFRDQAAHLCLDQPLGGDAAFTDFHTANLDEVLDHLGARGYRTSHLAAGVASGRLALAAFALGYGASGITFLDDEVSRFFSTEDSCLLATVVGVPAYRNRPGGRPRAPAELRRLVRPRLR